MAALASSWAGSATTAATDAATAAGAGSSTLALLTAGLRSSDCASANDLFATQTSRSTFLLMTSGSFDSRTCLKHASPTPYAFACFSSAMDLNLFFG